MIYLSNLSYIYGKQRDVRDLNEHSAGNTLNKAQGISHYTASDQPIWEMAAAVAEQTCASSTTDPDMVLMLTENDADRTDSMARLVSRLGLGQVAFCAIAGHGCGNLGPALEIARNVIETGQRGQVLVVMADRVLAHGRLMRNGLSVLSDGAAACMVGGDPPSAAGAGFAVNSLSVKTAVGPDVDDLARITQATLSLGRQALHHVLTSSSSSTRDFKHICFPNYRIPSQRFLNAALGGSDEQLLIGPVESFGHSYSTDIIANLKIFHDGGEIEVGDRLLVSANGPFTWTMLDIECHRGTDR